MSKTMRSLVNLSAFLAVASILVSSPLSDAFAQTNRSVTYSWQIGGILSNGFDIGAPSSREGLCSLDSDRRRLTKKTGVTLFTGPGGAQKPVACHDSSGAEQWQNVEQTVGRTRIPECYVSVERKTSWTSSLLGPRNISLGARLA